MNVGPAIEIVNAEATLPNQGLPKPVVNDAIASGKAQRSDGFGPNPTSRRDSSGVGAEESFRARWQALLAGQGDGARGPDAEEASQAEGQRTLDAGMLAATRISSPAAPRIGAGAPQISLLAVSGPRATLGRSQGTGRLETALTERTSTTKARTHHADWLRKHHEAHPAGQAKSDGVATGALPTPNPAIAVSIVPATPAPADPAGSPARPLVDGIDAQPGRAFAKGFSGQHPIPREQRVDSGNSVPAVKGSDAPTASVAPDAMIAGDLPVGHTAQGGEGTDAKDAEVSYPAPSAVIQKTGSLSSPIQAVPAATLQTSVSQSQNPGQVQPQESGNAGPSAIRNAGDAGSASSRGASPAAAVSGHTGRAEAAKQSISVVRKSEQSVQILHADHRREETIADPGADASSVLTHDPAAVRGAIEIAGGSSAGTSTADSASAHAAFSALDADTGMAARGWIHTSGHHAEAGFQDPALGWIGVRAEMSGGNVHALLVPGSADAARVLGGQIDGLHSYLAEHHAPVSNITLAAPESHGAGWSAGQGANQGMHHGSGQQSGQDAPAQPHVDPQPGPAIFANVPASSAHSGGSEAILPMRRGGAYISVLA